MAGAVSGAPAFRGEAAEAPGPRDGSGEAAPFGDRPRLSICIPTCERPRLLLRALESARRDATADVEIVVCDNSEHDDSARLCERLPERAIGRDRYVRNRPAVGLVGNHNRCVAESQGEWLHILHDDDYLLPGGITAILRAIESVGDECRALLFGVQVVDADGKIIRRQTFARLRRLTPPEALRALLGRSSFVRPPAMVVRRSAYGELGGFAPEMEGTNDVDMWVRLFSAFGVTCVPETTVAYTVHPGALTNGVFEPGTIARLGRIFDRVAQEGILSEDDTRRCQREFLHQFILAGTCRRIRARDRAGARAVMELFALPAVRRLGRSTRWAPLRAALSLVTL